MTRRNFIGLVILHVVDQYLVGIGRVIGVVNVHYRAIESNPRGVGLSGQAGRSRRRHVTKDSAVVPVGNTWARGISPGRVPPLRYHPENGGYKDGLHRKRRRRRKTQSTAGLCLLDGEELGAGI